MNLVLLTLKNYTLKVQVSGFQQIWKNEGLPQPQPSITDHISRLTMYRPACGKYGVAAESAEVESHQGEPVHGHVDALGASPGHRVIVHAHLRVAAWAKHILI